MKKLAIVINGVGGVGKDTLCDLAARHFKVVNISSVTPVKELAAIAGWDGRKDDKSRKFLSDLKRLLADYNDYPTNWALERYHAFLESENDILFVHIREGSEIKKFVNATGGAARTLLIRGGERMRRHSNYGNVSDDLVEEYAYDYCYLNDKALNTAEEEFVRLMQKMMDDMPENV